MVGLDVKIACELVPPLCLVTTVRLKLLPDELQDRWICPYSSVLACTLTADSGFGKFTVVVKYLKVKTSFSLGIRSFQTPSKVMVFEPETK